TSKESFSILLSSESPLSDFAHNTPFSTTILISVTSLPSGNLYLPVYSVKESDLGVCWADRIKVPDKAKRSNSSFFILFVEVLFFCWLPAISTFKPIHKLPRRPGPHLHTLLPHRISHFSSAFHAKELLRF